MIETTRFLSAERGDQSDKEVQNRHPIGLKTNKTEPLYHLKEQASLTFPPMNEKYTIYQLLKDRHKFIKEMYFLVIFITLISLFTC